MLSINKSAGLLLLLLSIALTSCKGKDPFSISYDGAPAPFPTDNAAKIETDSGLIYYVIEEGSGDGVMRRNQVYVYYTGRRMNGTIFDSSFRNGSTRPSLFSDIGGLIDGFQEGLLGMKKGEKRVLIIPPHLGYGASKTHSLRKDTLRFDIELENIVY